MHDRAFQDANQVFLGKIRKLQQDGLDQTKHKDAVHAGDMAKLYDSGTLAIDNPVALQRKVYLEVSLHFCRRGREGLCELRKDSYVGNMWHWDVMSWKKIIRASRRMTLVRSHACMARQVTCALSVALSCTSVSYIVSVQGFFREPIRTTRTTCQSIKIHCCPWWKICPRLGAFVGCIPIIVCEWQLYLSCMHMEWIARTFVPFLITGALMAWSLIVRVRLTRDGMNMEDRAQLLSPFLRHRQLLHNHQHPQGVYLGWVTVIKTLIWRLRQQLCRLYRQLSQIVWTMVH